MERTELPRLHANVMRAGRGAEQDRKLGRGRGGERRKDRERLIGTEKGERGCLRKMRERKGITERGQDNRDAGKEDKRAREKGRIKSCAIRDKEGVR